MALEPGIACRILNLGGFRMQYTHTLPDHFEKMGSRLKVGELPVPWRKDEGPWYTLDIGRDRRGSYFDMKLRPDTEFDIWVPDTMPRLRHLLLMIRHLEKDKAVAPLHRFLCGHDERDWFAAAVPNRGRVSSVMDALEALKPTPVLNSLAKHGVKGKDRNRRRNEAYLRQGEWFFIPWPFYEEKERPVLKNEPLMRGGGKPHMAEELTRWGGKLIYRHSKYGSQDFSEQEREALIHRDVNAPRRGWRMLRRNPWVVARGKIRHPDHKTLVLKGWHRVVSNTENLSPARPFLAFYD